MTTNVRAGRWHVLVVIPAQDEEDCIGACLNSVAQALNHAAAVCASHRVVVTADSCSDDTASAAEGAMQSLRLSGRVILSAAGSAARARHAACEAACEDAGPGTWVATTDADSIVPPDWLATQLALADKGADAVAGEVALGQSEELPPQVRAWYAGLLASRRDSTGGHSGVYGANLGVTWESLNGIGGIPDVTCGEDRELVRRLRQSGAVVATPTHPVVTTSARLLGRAQGGLADLLRRHAHATGVGPTP